LSAPGQPECKFRLEHVLRFAVAGVRRNVKLVELYFALWEHIDVGFGKRPPGCPFRLVRRSDAIGFRRDTVYADISAEDFHRLKF